jgi:hypothetical protein
MARQQWTLNRLKVRNNHHNLANHCYHGAEYSHKGNYNVRCCHDEWLGIRVGGVAEAAC